MPAAASGHTSSTLAACVHGPHAKLSKVVARQHTMCAAVRTLQAGMYPEAAKAAVRVTDPNLTKHASNLLAVIAFEQDNLPGAERSASAGWDLVYTSTPHAAMGARPRAACRLAACCAGTTPTNS